MEQNTSRAEAERLLGVAEKLLYSRDLHGSREFAVLAQETEPLLDGSDQILAVTDVLLAADRRINNNNHDWYAILQIDGRNNDLDLVKKQYRRLALLLHPDKNKFPYADSAFKLVADAWAVLSDSGRKSLFDNELNLFSKVDLQAMRRQKEFQQQQDPNFFNQQKLLVRRSAQENNPTGRKDNTNSSPVRSTSTQRATRLSSFWTVCPYCYNLYEYPRVYENCCLRCQNCQRAFTAAEIQSLPPLVPGKESYYCCWAFFPMGFTVSNSEAGKHVKFPYWMPPMFPNSETAAVADENGEGFVGVSARNAAPAGEGFVSVAARNVPPAQPSSKKRGRPRKYT